MEEKNRIIIVVLNPKNEIDLANATNNLKETEGAVRLSKSTWKIDLHRSLAFFCTLLHKAGERDIAVAVYEVGHILREDNFPSLTGKRLGGQVFTFSI